MGGYDIGASLSGSSSSAASNSGAQDISGGGAYGSTPYGAGSVVFGAIPGGLSISTPILIGALAAASFVMWLLFRK
ncbi:MAG TPA: hypothetical protein VEH04_11380 [Verrucomicrobiae bacterium]|nr:hypothetical protein [Verrucomicrobiae bacterium]